MTKGTQKKLIFIAIFAILGFVSLQIPITKLAGSNVAFTLFDFVGPIAGAFLGGPLGILAVAIVSLSNFALQGADFSAGPLIRLFPTLFAVWYFAQPVNDTKDKKILAVPIIAILAFVMHPNGREVWYYTLFWLIPVMTFFMRDILILRALGATFTAHAVGGAAWIWAFNLPAAVWQGLIPVVITERLVFASGIALSFIIINNLISYLTDKNLLPKGLTLEKPYLYLKK